MNFNERLRKAREFRNLRQDELATLVGYSQTAISLLESDPKRKTKKILKFAQVLQCNPDWLDTGKGQPPWDQTLPNTYEVIPGLSAPLVIANLADPEAFRYKVDDDAMSDPHDPRRSMHLNQIAIIYPNLKPENGEIVLALKKGEKKPIFREYRIDGERIFLKAFNPDITYYPRIPIEDIERIIGTVIHYGYGLFDKKLVIEK